MRISDWSSDVCSSDLKGRGLGRALMERIMSYAVKRGIGEVWGEVLADNARMLALCDEPGIDRAFAEDGIVHVRRQVARQREADQAAALGRSSTKPAARTVRIRSSSPPRFHAFRTAGRRPSPVCVWTGQSAHPTNSRRGGTPRRVG